MDTVDEAREDHAGGGGREGTDAQLLVEDHVVRQGAAGEAESGSTRCMREKGIREIHGGTVRFLLHFLV